MHLKYLNHIWSAKLERQGKVNRKIETITPFQYLRLLKPLQTLAYCLEQRTLSFRLEFLNFEAYLKGEKNPHFLLAAVNFRSQVSDFPCFGVSILYFHLFIYKNTPN